MFPDDPVPKRWFRFSLRTLFVVVAVAAATSLMATWAIESCELWQQLTEADRIILRGGI